jgi:hypothetical protein
VRTQICYADQILWNGRSPADRSLAQRLRFSESARHDIRLGGVKFDISGGPCKLDSHTLHERHLPDQRNKGVEIGTVRDLVTGITARGNAARSFKPPTALGASNHGGAEGSLQKLVSDTEQALGVDHQRIGVSLNHFSPVRRRKRILHGFAFNPLRKDVRAPKHCLAGPRPQERR